MSQPTPRRAVSKDIPVPRWLLALLVALALLPTGLTAYATLIGW